MDPTRPPDPNDRPSIFSRPDDEDEELRATAPPRRPEPTDWHDDSTRAHRAAGAERRIPSSPPVMAAAAQQPVTRTRFSEPIDAEPRRAMSRRRKLALGGAGLAGLVVVGFAVALLTRSPDVEPALAGASASPTDSPTPSATVEPSETPEPTPSATPSPTASPVPTPAPTPAGPPQELARGGWATVSVDELNVRREPSLQAASDYRLVRGAAIYLRGDEPVGSDGLLWYRIRSLGGADGWAASGPQSSPFISIIVEDPYLQHCGQVEHQVFDVADGGLRARDPIRIGGIALPAARFTDTELGLFELAWGTRAEACIGAEAQADGTATVYVDSYVSACGRPELREGIRRMIPDPGVDAIHESRVKVRTLVHPAVLTSMSSNDRSSTNLRSVFALSAQNEGVTGCLEIRISRRPQGMEYYQMMHAVQCVVVESFDGTELTLRPAAGGDRQTMYPSAVLDGTLGIGSPTMQGVAAHEMSNQHWSDAGAGLEPYAHLYCG